MKFLKNFRPVEAHQAYKEEAVSNMVIESATPLVLLQTKGAISCQSTPNLISWVRNMIRLLEGLNIRKLTKLIDALNGVPIGPKVRNMIQMMALWIWCSLHQKNAL